MAARVHSFDGHFKFLEIEPETGAIALGFLGPDGDHLWVTIPKDSLADLARKIAPLVAEDGARKPRGSIE